MAADRAKTPVGILEERLLRYRHFHDMDRASMAVSLEVRPVYLHRDMMNLASRIPPALLADRNQSKKLLKASLRPWLPDSILYRRKMGFAMPLQKWVGGDLQSLFSDGGRQSALEDWLDVGRLGALARVRAQENGGSALLAHNLLFLEHWREQWISGSGGAEVSSRQNGVTSLAHP